MNYLAVDIGASSGRLMLSTLNEARHITLTEIHRFKNSATKTGTYRTWDVHHLVTEILTGLEKLKAQGITNCTLGIDTWGVDYCIVDENNQLVGEAISYRDPRTEGVMEKFAQVYPLAKLYEKTGIQLQPFNTVFQLFLEEDDRLKKENTLLLMPDYLNFALTGKKFLERTNASTTGLVNLFNQTVDQDILKVLHVPEELFPPFIEAGSVVGPLLKEAYPDYDLPDVTVVAVGSHDTASAVLGTPSNEATNWAYISSGTWSLLGKELATPNNQDAAFKANYTNEGGVFNTTRLLKNIMGMWLIQEVARNQNYAISFGEYVELAKKEPGFQQLVDVNHEDFLHPDNMVEALQNYCESHGEKIPTTPGEIACCIYDNLALCYAYELEKLVEITNEPIDVLHIVGGGCQNKFLNQLTANVAKIPVEAGPIEATALGNIMMQMIAQKEFSGVKEAREVLKVSFPTERFEPQAMKNPFEDYKNFIQEEL